jgi:hypothetical protein
MVSLRPPPVCHSWEKTKKDEVFGGASRWNGEGFLIPFMGDIIVVFCREINQADAT